MHDVSETCLQSTTYFDAAKWSNHSGFVCCISHFVFFMLIIYATLAWWFYILFLVFFRSDTEAWFHSWNSSSGQCKDTSWSCRFSYADGDVSLSLLLSIHLNNKWSPVIMGDMHILVFSYWQWCSCNNAPKIGCNRSFPMVLCVFSCIMQWRIKINWNSLGARFAVSDLDDKSSIMPLLKS